jgi:hypothetical protein
MQEYQLDDFDPAAVHFLVLWLYTQNLELYQLSVEAPADMKLMSKESLASSNLWVLADKLLIPRLQNLVINSIEKIRKKQNAVATWPSNLNYIYSNTTAESPLRRLIVHYCATDLGTGSYSTHNQFPKEMLLDIITFLFHSHLTRRSLASNRDMKDYEVKEV